MPSHNLLRLCNPYCTKHGSVDGASHHDNPKDNLRIHLCRTFSPPLVHFPQHNQVRNAGNPKSSRPTRSTAACFLCRRRQRFVKASSRGGRFRPGDQFCNGRNQSLGNNHDRLVAPAERRLVFGYRFIVHLGLVVLQNRANTRFAPSCGKSVLFPHLFFFLIRRRYANRALPVN